MKTLLDIYTSAGKAALGVIELDGIELARAKVKAHDEAGLDLADSSQWETFFEEHYHKYKDLAKQKSPSARKNPAS